MGVLECQAFPRPLSCPRTKVRDNLAGVFAATPLCQPLLPLPHWSLRWLQIVRLHQRWHALSLLVTTTATCSWRYTCDLPSRNAAEFHQALQIRARQRVKILCWLPRSLLQKLGLREGRSKGAPELNR